MKKPEPVPVFQHKPNSLWLVVHDCRHDVIRVSPDGKGFFAPGQDPCWGLDCVTEWVREIGTKDNSEDDFFVFVDGLDGDSYHGLSTTLDMVKHALENKAEKIIIRRSHL